MTRHYGAEATNALLPGKASKHQVTSNRTPNLSRMRMAHAWIENKRLPNLDFSRVTEYYFDGSTVACPLPPSMVSFLNSGGTFPNCRTHFTSLSIDDSNMICGQVHVSRYPCSIAPMVFIPPFIPETADIPTNFTASFGNFTIEFFNDEISIFAAYIDRRTGARRNYRREYASYKMQPISEAYGEPHVGYTRTYSKPKWAKFVLGDTFVVANMTNTDGIIHEYRFDYMTNRDRPYLKLSGAVYNVNHTWIDSPNYDSVRRVTVAFAFNFRVAHSPVSGIPLTCGPGQLFNSRCSSSVADLTSNLDFFSGEYVVEAKTTTVDMVFRFLPAGSIDGDPLTFNNGRLFVNRIPAPFPDGSWLERATVAGYRPNVTTTPEEIQALSVPLGISIPRFYQKFAFDPDVSITLLFNPNDKLPPDTATPSELQLQNSLNVGAVVAGTVVAAVVIIGGVTAFAFVVFPYLKARKQAEEVQKASRAEELNHSQAQQDSANTNRWTAVRPKSAS
eukprot:TRINITY_DN2743_c0_g1_i2.p1 TRINITY_DN2743_c0_g1~~TRINITY_DN2743_c0_g1_i2.p1  ORF type:complete len:503 (-),score=67.81 TRINITY_DN2743_c0_g1_i2:14-1522(-)